MITMQSYAVICSHSCILARTLEPQGLHCGYMLQAWSELDCRHHQLQIYTIVHDHFSIKHPSISPHVLKSIQHKFCWAQLSHTAWQITTAQATITTISHNLTHQLCNFILKFHPATGATAADHPKSSPMDGTYLENT